MITDTHTHHQQTAEQPTSDNHCRGEDAGGHSGHEPAPGKLESQSTMCCDKTSAWRHAQLPRQGHHSRTGRGWEDCPASMHLHCTVLCVGEWDGAGDLAGHLTAPLSVILSVCSAWPCPVELETNFCEA